MFDIQHNGFVARLSVDGDLIRGEVLDTHESLIIEGQSIREIKEDFAIKIESYCARCKRGMSRVLLKLAKRSLPSMILRDFEL